MAYILSHMQNQQYNSTRQSMRTTMTNYVNVLVAANALWPLTDKWQLREAIHSNMHPNLINGQIWRVGRGASYNIWNIKDAIGLITTWGNSHFL